MIVAEINYRDASNVAQTALFCNGLGFHTLPTDTPANATVLPYMTDAGFFQRDMFAGSAVAGAVKAGQGALEFTNLNRRLDAWEGYAVDGQTITLRIGDEGSAYPSGFTTLVIAKMQRLEMGRKTMRIYLRDRIADFNKPMCTAVFLGTGGIEGPASFTGRRVPKGYGHVFNAKPILLDSTLGLYRMSSSYETSTLDQYVRDGGAVMGNDPAYSSRSDLLTGSAPTAGYAKHYAPDGCFRLGSATVYDVTADRKFHDATTTVASKLVEKMALDAGVSSGDIDTVSSLGLNAGYYSEGDETPFLTAMQAVAEGSGLWFGWSRLGKLQIGQLTDPVGGSSTATFLNHQIKELSSSAPPGFEVPTQRVRLRYQKNWHPLSQVAGSVSLTDKEFFAKEWSVTQAEDTSIATRHPYAVDFTRDTYSVTLSSYAAPTTECSRILTLFKADRRLIKMGIPLTAANAVHDLGTILTLQTPDFGLSAGKKFIVVSHRIDMRAKRIQLGLWG